MIFCSFLLVSASFSFSQNQSLPKVTTSTVMLVSHGTHRIAYLNVMKLRFFPNSEDLFVLFVCFRHGENDGHGHVLFICGD